MSTACGKKNDTLKRYSMSGSTLDLGWLLVLGLYTDDYLLIFKCVSVWLHSFCGEWEGLIPLTGLTRQVG